MAGRTFIGTSGYVYAHWRTRFYPPSLPASGWLPYYAAHFDTVELNNPFYRLPEAAVFAAWRAGVPSGFTFAVKASRYLTHFRKLKRPADPLRRLLVRARRLRPKLGPVLFQLPGNFRADLPRLDVCLADWRECPVHDVITADFVYVRRHGTRRRYGGSYSEGELRGDARAIRGW